MTAESTKSYFDNTRLLKRTILKMTDSSNHVIRDTMRFEYDSLGHVSSLDRYGNAADMNYQYDLVHGWLTGITSEGGFAQHLIRESHSTKPLFNGSISAMTWKVPNNSYLRRYDYTYDGLNRLVEGKYTQQLVIVPPIINSTGNDPLALGGSDGEAMPLDLIPVTGIVGPGGINASDRYTERIAYDRNSNIANIERYGMNNLHQYGLIDSLVITRNGNQLKTIEDYAEKQLTYSGASDFYDGMTSNNEYSYNANGALVKDLNRKIGFIGYDNLGNIRNISFHTANANSIDYIYAADGTKLRTIHRNLGSLYAYIDSIDYIGNLILKNGQPSMYLFDGGYVSFNNDTINGWHYYIQDYLDNNRMVVNKNGTVEQVTHYYPYGGVIGDISTNENVQKYKFEGKELDRTFGLDNFDIHARQYFAMMPSWDRIDRKAEDYYSISPYSFCGGNPVIIGDYNGEAWITASFGSIEFYCFDPEIETEDDINKKYYYGDNVNDKKIKLVGGTGSFTKGDKTYILNEDGSYSYYTGSCVTCVSGETDEGNLHIGNIGKNERLNNYYGNYLGDNNPTQGKDDIYSYCLPPIDELDYAAYLHDKGYDLLGEEGLSGVCSPKTVEFDLMLTYLSAKDYKKSKKLPESNYIRKRRLWSLLTTIGFGFLGCAKVAN